LSVPFLCALSVLTLSLRPWTWGDGSVKRLLLALFLGLFCLLFHAHTGSDGAQYYANLRSLWLDGDLNFYDDAVRHPEMYGDTYLGTLHPRGYTYNGFSVGPALFWTPFFGMAHAWCEGVNRFVSRYACDGYDYPYLLMVCIASALYGLAGAAVVYRLLRQWTGPVAAGWSTALVTFASPLLLYLYYECTYAHALAYLMGAVVVGCWWKRYHLTKRDGDAPLRYSVALGVAIGLAMLVRWQNGIYLVFPLFDAVEQLVRATRERRLNVGCYGRMVCCWFAVPWLPCRRWPCGTFRPGFGYICRRAGNT